MRVARAQVNAEARYATIQLTLQTPQSSVVPAAPSRWDNAVDRAVEILTLEAMIVLYALVIVGPLALLVLLAWLGRRGPAPQAGRAAALGAVGERRRLPPTKRRASRSAPPRRP